MIDEYGWQIMLILLLLLTLVGWIVNRKKYPCSSQRKIKAPNLGKTDDQFFRDQMSPHFLYNSFNAIKLLIQQMRNEEAVDYLVDFSKLMRNVVNHSEKEKIRLSEELETVKLFLSLYQLRYKDQFQYHIEVDETIDINKCEVPPLVLRPYLEQAIWRGLLNLELTNRVVLSVKAQSGKLLIRLEDNGISQEQARKYLEKKGKDPATNGGEMAKWDRLSNLESACRQVSVKDKLDGSGVITEIRFESIEIN